MKQTILFSEYYKAVQISKTQTRYDVLKKYGTHSIFDKMLLNKARFNVGGLSFSYGVYTYGSASSKLKPQMSISRGKHISGVYVPDITNNLIAYGDIVGTNDAIILLFSDNHNTIEIFVARGMVYDSINLYNQTKEGVFNDEFEYLRSMATNVFKELK